jgi:hypothetical protein
MNFHVQVWTSPRVVLDSRWSIDRHLRKWQYQLHNMHRQFNNHNLRFLWYLTIGAKFYLPHMVRSLSLLNFRQVFCNFSLINNFIILGNKLYYYAMSLSSSQFLTPSSHKCYPGHWFGVPLTSCPTTVHQRGCTLLLCLYSQYQTIAILQRRYTTSQYD